MQYIVLQFDDIKYRYKVYNDEIKRYMTNVLHSLGERERKKKYLTYYSTPLIEYTLLLIQVQFNQSVGLPENRNKQDYTLHQREYP